MSARMRFWIILGVAVVLAVVAWALALPRLVQTNENLAGELGEMQERVFEATSDAVGGPSLEARTKAQLRTEGAVKESVERFAEPDRRELDRWFDDIGRKWSARPSPGEFKRFYLLEADALRRDLTGLYEAAGLGARTAPLIEHSWMGDDETPDANSLPEYQREFHVQARVLQVLAEAGVWLERPITLGARARLGGVAVQRDFEAIPVKANALVRPRDLRRGLHAFDRTGKGLGIRVRNARIARRGDVEPPEEGDPPLRLVFDLEVLDYDHKSAKKEG